MSTNAQGPVCHIPPKTTAQTHAPVPLPNVPPAEPNLASLTATVNALRNLVMILSGQMGAPGKNGTRGSPGSAGKAAPAGSWEQHDIQTEKVKVTNPDDDSQYVEIQRVNKLVMINPQTKQTWTFNRPGSGGS